APSSNSGVLPLANFGSVAFSGASASVGSNTGSISAFPNASINMITRFGQLLDTTSNLTSSGDGFTVTTTGSSTSTSGRGHHRHGLPTIIGNGQTTVVNVPPVPTAAMATTSTTVLSVAHANILDTGAVTVAQNSQAIPPRGYLIVAPTAPDTTDDVP